MIFRLFLLNSHQKNDYSQDIITGANMPDILNIIQQIDELKSEISALKTETQYLRNKASIGPLISNYNERFSKGQVPFGITIFTHNGQSRDFVNEPLFIQNENLVIEREKGYKDYCRISDISKIELIRMVNAKPIFFRHEFKQ